MSHQANSVAPETHPFDAAIQLEKSDDGHLIGHMQAMQILSVRSGVSLRRHF